MPRLVLVVLLLAACPASTTQPKPAKPAPPAPPAPATVEVLRTASGALVRIKPATNEDGDRLQLFAGVTLSQVRQRPAAVLLGIAARGRQFRFEGCQELSLQLGGPVMNVPAEREAQIGHGTLTELLLSAVPLATVERLGRATEATVAACGEQLTLGPADFALLRRFLARLQAEIEGG